MTAIRRAITLTAPYSIGGRLADEIRDAFQCPDDTQLSISKRDEAWVMSLVWFEDDPTEEKIPHDQA